VKAVPDLVEGQALPELERDLARTLGVQLSIPVLTRTWQILLKGMQEVAHAPHAYQALDMVLIRLAHVSDMPPPGELVKRLSESGTGGGAPAPYSGGGGGGTVAQRGNTLLKVAHSQPVEAIQAVSQAPRVNQAAMPADFPALVALFVEKRELAIAHHLQSDVVVVNYHIGHVEIAVREKAPGNLAGKIMQHMQEWTGQRWLVSLVNNHGGATLAEQAAADKDALLTQAKAHPLVQAVLSAIPSAKLMRVTKKATPPADDTSSIKDNPQNEAMVFEE
jgi:DNA polymerase-3 subunit gamma/tau